MNRFLLPIYHRLPYAARCAAASLAGAHLNRWRYARETEALVQEARERERWTAAEWDRWREDTLARVLHRAATKVPYYRELWAERRRKGDRASWDVLAHWPVLEKEVLRGNPASFIAGDCDRRRMYAEHTSGTTGTPITLWRTRETLRKWYALHEARTRVWYGVSKEDRWAIVGGRPIVRAGQRKPPFWVWSSTLKQLYLSAFHVSPRNSGFYLDALSRYKIKYMLGYSASMAALARDAISLNRRIPLKVVITNAEPLTQAQRKVIEEAFLCPVRETYGLAEIVAAASECEAGHLHEWPEAGVIETGEGGELICTSLIGPEMPLIRYRTGDRRFAPVRTERCLCGRRLPLFGRVEGRSDDVLYLADGRQIGRLDPIFKAELPIRESQIIQKAVDRLHVRYVPAEGFTSGTPDVIARSIRNFIGPVGIVLERVEAIPRTANGKFRAVICQIPADQRPVSEKVAGQLT